MFDRRMMDVARKYLISHMGRGGVAASTVDGKQDIDLIARIEGSGRLQGPIACHIKLRPSEKERFGVQRSYEAIQGLLIVYVWKVFSDSPDVLSLTYSEAEALLERTGKTKMRSWVELRGFSLAVNCWWKDELRRYRVSPEQWPEKIIRAHQIRVAKNS